MRTLGPTSRADSPSLSQNRYLCLCFSRPFVPHYLLAHLYLICFVFFFVFSTRREWALPSQCLGSPASLPTKFCHVSISFLLFYFLLFYSSFFLLPFVSSHHDTLDTYWCLDKGYAKFVGEQVPATDRYVLEQIICSLFIYQNYIYHIVILN